MLRIYKTIENKLTEVNSLKDENIWIDVNNPTEQELTTLCDCFNLDIDLLKAPLDEEERPRIEAYDDQVLILISMPYTTSENSQIVYNTLPIGILVTEKAIITVSLKESTLVEQFIKQKIAPATHKRTRFVLQLLYNNARLFLSRLKEIDKKSTEIEKHLHRSSKNEELISLLNLEKSLVYFTTALRSNEIVFEKLLRTYLRKVHDEESQVTVKMLKKYEEDEDLLEDVITENKQAIDMADIYTNILGGTMDAFASIISNNLNIVMKFLAIITIVMAVPTIITSFYGMNVPLPYQASPFAYIGITILSVVLMICGAIIITKNKLN